MIPVCPDCGRQLEMLRRYEWAPSIAMCASCAKTVAVVYDRDDKRWTVFVSKPKEA